MCRALPCCCSPCCSGRDFCRQNFCRQNLYSCTSCCLPHTRMPPSTRRCPLSTISANVIHHPLHSPKPHDLLASKLSTRLNSPAKSPRTFLNAKPAAHVTNEVEWYICDSSNFLRCDPFLKPTGVSYSHLCSLSLSSLLPALHHPKLRNRLRALKMLCDVGQLIQSRCIPVSASPEERREVDHQNSQCDAALRSFELHGGCAALVKLLQDGNEGIECGALLGLALLCAAGRASFCARICSEGGLSASISALNRPWGKKCRTSVMGLLLNCSSHAICHASFCEKDICALLMSFLRIDEFSKELQLVNYACSAIANLFGGEATRNFLILNYSDSLKSMFLLASKCCSSAVLAIKNLCCCCSRSECANLSITGNDLIELVYHLLPLSANSAEVASSALQCYCLHSPLHPQQMRSLVEFLPHAGALRSALLAALCNATVHRACPKMH